ncbi:hypothetical protein N7G274_010179 [Stereocaulon virgatum]|uniref:Uncharacterized protein n=1 Tax=Stereocaulon virgatum TaxID=373712 RepID=A0ABR3ZY97_9LECA
MSPITPFRAGYTTLEVQDHPRGCKIHRHLQTEPSLLRNRYSSFYISKHFGVSTQEAMSASATVQKKLTNADGKMRCVGCWYHPPYTPTIHFRLTHELNFFFS